MSENWNGITPAPGMLANYIGGLGVPEWRVLTKGDGFAFNSQHWEYLAPAPTPGGLWAAVLALANTLGREEWGIHFEAGMSFMMLWHHPDICTRINQSGQCTLHFHNSPWLSTAAELATLDTARQHHGALLAYCAQPGWEETK
jgi:hypothetical protein